MTIVIRRVAERTPFGNFQFFRLALRHLRQRRVVPGAPGMRAAAARHERMPTRDWLSRWEGREAHWILRESRSEAASTHSAEHATIAAATRSRLTRWLAGRTLAVAVRACEGHAEATTASGTGLRSPGRSPAPRGAQVLPLLRTTSTSRLTVRRHRSVSSALGVSPCRDLYACRRGLERRVPA